MYNEEFKNRFINECTNHNNLQRTQRIFRLSEQFESGFGKDLCIMSDDELREALEEVTGARLGTQTADYTILRKYFKWCKDNGIVNARSDVAIVGDANHNKLYDSMVDSPELLEEYLNVVFSPIGDCKPDNIYRGYFWLSFMGVKEDEMRMVTSGDVNLKRMVVRLNGREYPIYRESVQLFRFLCTASSFVCDRVVYEVITERDYGDQLLRGTRKNSGVNVESIRRMASKRVEAATSSTGKNIPLRYKALRLSGFFYRIYVDEMSGQEIDFSERILEYDCEASNLPSNRFARKKKEFQTDYERWKLAFNK